jgi:hypothetical protein
MATEEHLSSDERDAQGLATIPIMLVSDRVLVRITALPAACLATGMAAIGKSGRSDHRISREIKGRFRPDIASPSCFQR